MALNSNALTTVPQAKAYLKIPLLETSQDAMVELFINSASQDMESECDRVLKQRAGIVEFQDGRSQNMILLKQWPVTAITELRVDVSSKFTDAATIVDPAAYAIADDQCSLYYIRTHFPIGHRAIKVTYTAGFATVPSDLEHAVLWSVAWYNGVRNAQDIGRTTKSKEGETTSYLQTAPQYVKDVVARYKRTECLVPNMATSNL